MALRRVLLAVLSFAMLVGLVMSEDPLCIATTPGPWQYTAENSGGTLEEAMLSYIDPCRGHSGWPTKSTYEFDGIPYLSTTYSGYPEFNDRVEPYNPLVREKALEIASKYPGGYSIDQICAIYDYMFSGWQYVNDPSGGDYINYANESIRVGERTGCAGAGDCDDFAVLMASLIGAIGGTTRIITTRGSDGSHAYAEVYVGSGRTGSRNLGRVRELLKSANK